MRFQKWHGIYQNFNLIWFSIFLDSILSFFVQQNCGQLPPVYGGINRPQATNGAQIRHINKKLFPVPSTIL